MAECRASKSLGGGGLFIGRDSSNQRVTAYSTVLSSFKLQLLLLELQAVRVTLDRSANLNNAFDTAIMLEPLIPTIVAVRW